MIIDDEIDVLARTIWGEARGESEKGMLAVGCVIANRVHIVRHCRRYPLFGTGTFKSACQKRFQFSCWNTTDPNYSKLINVDLSDEKFKLSVDIASSIIYNHYSDITNKSTHYLTVSLYNSGRVRWANKLDKQTIIGNHVFLVNSNLYC